MKKLLLGWLLLLCSEIAFSQSTITVSDSRRFYFQRVDLQTGTTIFGSELSKTFVGEYDGRTREYRIMDSLRVELFTLNYPMSRDELRALLTAELNRNVATLTPFSEYSTDQVFIWLYSLNQDQDAPRSGQLNLGRLVDVFTGNVDNDLARVRQLEVLNNTYQQIQTYYLSYKILMSDKIATVIHQMDSAAGLNARIREAALYRELGLLRQGVSTSLTPLVPADLPVLPIRGLSLTDSGHNNLRNLIADQVDDINRHIVPYQQSIERFNSFRRTFLNNRYFAIEKVSLQFERGNLERIQVWVQNERGALEIYENIYAIGFTSINNYRSFQKMRLFLRKNPQVENKGIFLSDVVGNYDNLLDLYTRDYSPADTVINEYNPAHGPIILHRNRSINLFESRIYTDLQGINPDVPNGLVQIELNRRFNIHTVRRQFKGRTDIGFLSYFNIYGAITKIEEKERFLLLRNKNTIVNNQIVSPSYVSNLDLRRYENAVLGLDLNTFLFDYPDAKFTAYLDLGVRYGHIAMLETPSEVDNGVVTKTGDSIRFPGHTVTLALPKITLEFFSERRVGFNLSYAFQHTYAFTSNRFKQVSSYEKSDLDNRVIDPDARKSHMTELNIRIETNKSGNGQLFFRNRFFWQHRDTNTFFVQSQLGYWYNIVFRK